jgi:hypothetical protein
MRPFSGLGAIDRLAASRGFRSVCGVARFDRLATESPEELNRFLDDLRANGWIVKPSGHLGRQWPAYFFPRKGRFYYDPERMTYLDMLHERCHLASFVQRGNWKLGRYNSLACADEVAAYSAERQLLEETGGADPKYLEYLDRQIEYYLTLPEALKNP